MRFDILTLHPEMCSGPMGLSILGRARAAALIEIGIKDIRDHGHGRHRTVDDAPYGGGSGMVMRVDVVDAAIASVRQPGSHVVLMDAAGARFDQAAARRLAQHPHLVLVCGHYEGIDGRVREHLVDEALCIGDYVLTGGELPAMVIVDAVARMIPGVLGNPESAIEESFSSGRLEYPPFTRPREHRGWSVPEVLLSGHHSNIEKWRAEMGEQLTRQVRPDLLDET
ncbi:MAG: tRNA (guanosine(37)-N1)-methyltransferase TrmD [Myxococcota bacterium]|nr:tRNA (guanosine(37)-N1)-methyltransferase TrmD [Myxococcota bacterium]